VQIYHFHANANEETNQYHRRNKGSKRYFTDNDTVIERMLKQKHLNKHVYLSQVSCYSVIMIKNRIIYMIKMKRHKKSRKVYGREKKGEREYK
jgi:hypothetical protein